MTVTKEDVVAALMPDEPSYTASAAELGPEALPHLAELIHSDDPLLAAKATYMVGLIQDPASLEILASAAQSGERDVRVAAAATTENLTHPGVQKVISQLLRDEDLGVRRVALRAVPAEHGPEIAAALGVLETKQMSPGMHELLSNVKRGHA